MRPEPGDHTIMRCCGKLVVAELREFSGYVSANWHCVTCGGNFTHPIGEIDTANAHSSHSYEGPEPEEPTDDYAQYARNRVGHCDPPF